MKIYYIFKKMQKNNLHLIFPKPRQLPLSIVPIPLLYFRPCFIKCRFPIQVFYNLFVPDSSEPFTVWFVSFI